MNRAEAKKRAADARTPLPDLIPLALEFPEEVLENTQVAIPLMEQRGMDLYTGHAQPGSAEEADLLAVFRAIGVGQEKKAAQRFCAEANRRGIARQGPDAVVAAMAAGSGLLQGTGVGLVRGSWRRKDYGHIAYFYVARGYGEKDEVPLPLFVRLPYLSSIFFDVSRLHFEVRPVVATLNRLHAQDHLLVGPQELGGSVGWRRYAL